MINRWSLVRGTRRHLSSQLGTSAEHIEYTDGSSWGPQGGQTQHAPVITTIVPPKYICDHRISLENVCPNTADDIQAVGRRTYIQEALPCAGKEDSPEVLHAKQSVGPLGKEERRRGGEIGGVTFSKRFTTVVMSPAGDLGGIWDGPNVSGSGLRLRAKP